MTTFSHQLDTIPVMSVVLIMQKVQLMMRRKLITLRSPHIAFHSLLKQFYRLCLAKSKSWYQMLSQLQLQTNKQTNKKNRTKTTFSHLRLARIIPSTTNFAYSSCRDRQKWCQSFFDPTYSFFVAVELLCLCLYPFTLYKLLIRTLSSLQNTIIYKYWVMSASRHFRRCCLKANKISKSEGTRKVG